MTPSVTLTTPPFAYPLACGAGPWADGSVGTGLEGPLKQGPYFALLPCPAGQLTGKWWGSQSHRDKYQRQRRGLPPRLPVSLSVPVSRWHSLTPTVSLPEIPCPQP